MLHGPEDLRLRQQQSGTAQQLLPFALQLFRRNVPLHRQNLIPGRQIQHARRFDLPAEVSSALLLQGEEIQQHLDIQTHFHRRQVKGLFAGLVVHHPEVELVVLDPAVHPVHLAADAQLRVGLGDDYCRQLAPVAEGQFEFQRHEIRVPQLLRHLVDDRVGGVPQAGKEIPEPGIPPLQAVELLGLVFADVLPRQGVERLLVHLSKAAHGQHVPGDIFQQEVEEGADLGRVKGSRGPGLRPQAVLHEVGKMAGPHPLQPGRGHGDAVSVQRPDRRPGQGATLQRGCPLHGGQPVLKGGIFGEIPPQVATGGLPRRLQRR